MCFSFLRPAFLSEPVEAEGKNVCVFLDTRACYLVQALRTIGPEPCPGLTGTVVSTSKVVWWMCHCAQLQLPPITGRRVVLTDNVTNLVCDLSDQSG